MKLEFSCQIFEKISHIKFTGIRLLASALSHVDGQTHMPTLTVAFRNFATAPKKTKPLSKLTAGVTTYQ